MACAFAIAACKNFLRVKYVRLPDLLNDLIVARNTGTYKKIMQQYKRVDLSILDEWLLHVRSQIRWNNKKRNKCVKRKS